MSLKNLIRYVTVVLTVFVVLTPAVIGESCAKKVGPLPAVEQSSTVFYPAPNIICIVTGNGSTGRAISCLPKRMTMTCNECYTHCPEPPAKEPEPTK